MDRRIHIVYIPSKVWTIRSICRATYQKVWTVCGSTNHNIWTVRSISYTSTFHKIVKQSENRQTYRKKTEFSNDETYNFYASEIRNLIKIYIYPKSHKPVKNKVIEDTSSIIKRQAFNRYATYLCQFPARLHPLLLCFAASHRTCHHKRHPAVLLIRQNDKHTLKSPIGDRSARRSTKN